MRGLTVQSDKSLQVVELDDPIASAGEVLVSVAATALNRADLLQVRGGYPPPPGESEVPGLECSGTIVALGEGVTGFEVGDRVMALLAGGGHATRVAVPEGQLMPVPASLSLTEAAALPEVALTAWTNLVVEGSLCKGQTVLITAAASGVGTFAVQLARSLGARVLVAGRSPERLQPLLDSGAEAACALGPDLVVFARDHTDGRGVDLVLELVGGEQLGSSLAALRPLGRLVLVGLMAGRTAEVDLGLILTRRLRLIGSVLRARSREEKAGLVASFWEFAEARLATGELKPVIDRVMPFERLPEAYAQMAAGGLLGKLVLEVEES